jgi:hypothetical protein
VSADFERDIDGNLLPECERCHRVPNRVGICVDFDRHGMFCFVSIHDTPADEPRECHADPNPPREELLNG